MPQLSVPNVSALTFVPHPLLRGGHVQTLAGAYLWRRSPDAATQHRIELSDGDQLVVHDNRPDAWRTGDRVVLLLHGLAGCHESGYMSRIASKLCQRGFRVFRLDQRGCGAGAKLATQTFHAGRSDDVVQTLLQLKDLCGPCPVTVVGFSLGAAILLKMLVEQEDEPVGGLDSAIAVAPPIDLMRCSQNIGTGWNRIYDLSFVRSLMRYVRNRDVGDPAFELFRQGLRPRTLYEFDAMFTAPLGGFVDVMDYYTRCSTYQKLSQVAIPTRLLTAADDPLVPIETFGKTELPPAIQLIVTEDGGHLGYVGSRDSSADTDWHWMDWRIVDWVIEFDRIEPK